ncbi:para-nitrobenzyl esterase-like [Littorina saxatilis]|uniref:Carboxylic ester hydrolase n=1 Tax=Littorina saxatilis TaxID=31220 RepID=A0AAN9BWK4_9CAEN
MTSDVEYLLLRDKGPYHEVCVRSRLNLNPGLCKFYTAVSVIITLALLVLLACLVYVFVLVPSWQGRVLTWDGRTIHEAKIHVLANTHCGPVEGLAEGGVHVFRGIPYAVPPTGRRRWRKPEGLSREAGTCWRGTKRTQTFGEACVQPRDMHNLTAWTGSEDCLFLNVWTPSLHPPAPRPVMVWLHDGDMVYGSGNTAPFCPTPDVTEATGAVYVSVNYRLGPFGFLALDMRSHQHPSATIPGNFGLMDVILALNWIKVNIHSFGGDMDKVTVFGQSSGGTAILALLASPLASGLFHRAWLASPSAPFNASLAQTARDNHVTLNATGCRDLDCLRGLSTGHVMASTPWTVFHFWDGQSLFTMPTPGSFVWALPVVDDHVVKEDAIQAWLSGKGNDVPTMFTTTAQEVDLLPFDPNISSWSWRHYTATVKQQLSPFSPRIAQRALRLYPAAPAFTRSHPSGRPGQGERRNTGSKVTPEYQYTSLVSDVRVTCPVNVLANVTSAKFRSPVYRGVVTSCPSRPVMLPDGSTARYAFHGWDLFVFFGNFAAWGFHPTQADLQFQKMLRQQMVAFARDGRPEAPVWETARTCTALLSDHVFPVERYNKIKCDFWLGHGFLSHA